MKTAIIKLLTELNIEYTEKPHAKKGYSYYFKLFGGQYCLFTSCWNDYGLHFVYKTRKNGKDLFQKIIDFENNLDRISLILKTIVEYRDLKGY